MSPLVVIGLVSPVTVSVAGTHAEPLYFRYWFVVGAVEETATPWIPATTALVSVPERSPPAPGRLLEAIVPVSWFAFTVALLARLLAVVAVAALPVVLFESVPAAATSEAESAALERTPLVLCTRPVGSVVRSVPSA